MVSRSLLFAVFFLCFSILPAQAAEQVQHTAVRLVSPVTAVGEGDSVPAALEVTIDKGWKTYWRTPGDAGLAPVVTVLEGAANLSGATMHYPAPHRFTIFDLDNYGYTGAVVFPLDLKLAQKATPLDARLRVDLLVCSEICVPESHDVALSLPAGAATPSPDAALYEAAVARLPHVDTTGDAFTQAALSVGADNRLRLTVTVRLPQAPGDDADLFVESPGGEVGFARPETTYDRTTGLATMTTVATSDQAPEDAIAKLMQAPLVLTYVDGETALEARLPVNAPVPATDTPQQELIAPALSLGILLSALIGGLILNLMPCVLPVLSLKVLSVLSHGGAKTDRASRRKVLTHFMASAAGIVTSFWVIAAGLVIVKQTGESIGWGIQFQHPGFLVFLIVVILGFALNMWGLYEIPLPRFLAHRLGRNAHDAEPTVTGDFLTGAFATLLATPCTAPFLGTAVGFALAGSARDIFTIFTFLGIGLALPYVFLALMPGLFRFLPRPGKWMLKLRRVLAVALFATAVWLGSTLYTITTQPTLDSGWSALDPAVISTAVEDGKVVFVDITADWCLTCKANKRLVIDRDDVSSALAQPHIVKMQGDWTRRDPAIAAYLASFGRYGIPFNVVYGPGAPEGIALPELLTTRAVLNALTMAAGE